MKFREGNGFSRAFISLSVQGRSRVTIKHDALGLTSSHQMSAQLGAESSSEQFETSRLGHQMSLARAGAKGSLYNEVQCIMDNGHMTVPSPRA